MEVNPYLEEIPHNYFPSCVDSQDTSSIAEHDMLDKAVLAFNGRLWCGAYRLRDMWLNIQDLDCAAPRTSFGR